MACSKRPAPAAAADETCCKRRRFRIGSTADYEQTCCLGKGGFGAVIKARHRVTGETVAIKSPLPPDELDGEPADVLREARFLEAACDGNPHVVASHGLLHDLPTNSLCLAMEYVGGPSLHAFLQKRRHNPPLPESAVRSFMLQLLTGAKKMHERRIVHRDIKPENVLLGDDGKTAKICDLGLAMSLKTEPPYTEAGTLPYMAPEMLLGKPDYDARLDTWSLGCVMAELITGETLFGDGRDEDGQLLDIFRVLGLPDEKTWPGFTSLPHAEMPQLLFRLEEEEEGRQHKTGLGQLFTQEMLSEDGFQVLEGLLACNPDERLTAAAALELPWFAPPVVQPIEIIPPATPAKKKNVLRIKKPKKNVLRIPLAMWTKGQPV
ncbi:putative cyclin-dependent kinase F-2 [Brachypodium distachyon]|nr:putative cyclin-dependent kinase F-2 [Brachypodium distachyon]|eukprot:XP_003561909.1 putative cyclin-dependent kinase F-2 [Brachypodium distachyon]